MKGDQLKTRIIQEKMLIGQAIRTDNILISTGDDVPALNIALLELVCFQQN